MLEKIINSKTRLALLAQFFRNPDQKYYARELVRALDLDQANVHKELANLSAGGFIASQIIGGKKYFFANPESASFAGLKTLFAGQAAKSAQTGYIVMEEMANYYPMMATVAWNVKNANEFFKTLGLKNRFKSLVVTYNNNLCELIAPRREFMALSEEVLAKVKSVPAWGEDYVRRLGLVEQDLYRASINLKKMNLKKLSEAELFEVYERYYEIYVRLHAFHWLQTVSDFVDNLFSKYLLNYLKVKIGRAKHSLGDVFSVLTTPTALAKPAEEYKNLLLILKYIISRPKLKQYFLATETRIISEDLAARDSRLDQLLRAHADDYGWLGYGTVGPAWDKAYFIDILSSLIRQKSDPDKLLQASETNRRETEARQKRLEADLDFDETHKKLFQFARDLVLTKGTRKDSMFHSYSVVENLYKEIGRRHYLSVRQVRFLQPHEFKALMINHDFASAVLNDRYESSVYFSRGDYRRDIFLTGAKAKKLLGQLNIVREEIGNVKILYGDCASPGRERGEVKIINEVKDMVKMNKGDILVSYATSPDLVPAIKKAAAIITNVGGITCHAAIISRELGIPCVVGTRIATKVLHDGDLVDVNATHGKINIIKKA